MKNRLVIKVGTSTLLDSHDSPSKAFEYIAESIKTLRNEYDVILVSSGAIGFGVTQLKIDERPKDLENLQALSMIGQVGLMKRWGRAFKDVTIGQVLVTRNDLHYDASIAYVQKSIQHVWAYGAVPIVNENDAISTDEISFGDNDQLAARIAVIIGANRLVLLTDQDGIMRGFGTDEQTRLTTVSIEEAKKHASPTKSGLGKGGVSSKLLAAADALDAGVEVFVAHAATHQSIELALTGQAGTKIVHY
ncbi:glutamate 5-kinase [Microbacteriaceae bacterium]|nr:glutamate 5-kinase [Candidatus Saccharibacteria bacterium]